ncbi:MAG: hypothetical protein SFY92_01465 [Verrucomicrobiae bacterium]|nr:hypothetical protein [Verrucomicrobiae bacterium]
MNRLLYVGISMWALLGGVGDVFSQEQSPEKTAESSPAAPTPEIFVGRRAYEEKFMYWGYVKREGEDWGKNTRLVVFRPEVPIPDQKEGPRGRDNNYEYKITGYFSGQKAYEPKSDLLMDVFVLQGYEVISTENDRLPLASIPQWTPAGIRKTVSRGGSSGQSSKSRPVRTLQEDEF